jgi:methylated-DNA-protein-cysteine methyltransferase related protein
MASYLAMMTEFLTMNYIPPPNKQIYYEQVWDLARQIPEGKVATYGQLGQLLDPPKDISPEDYKVLCPRWVGDAMAKCPDDVPWQRVINSQGKISQRFDAERHKQLLENDGLVFVNGKLDLKLCQWGNLEEDVPEQASLF